MPAFPQLFVEAGTALQHLEYELFVFTSAAPDQHFEVLEGGCFDNFVTVAGVNVEDAPGHAAPQLGVGRPDVAHATDWLSTLGHGSSLAWARATAQGGLNHPARPRWGGHLPSVGFLKG